MLTGKNIVISEFQRLDITDEYIAWLNDSDVVRFSNQRFVSHNRTTCEAYLASFLGTSNRFLVIRHNESNKMIGTMTVYRNLHHGTADVGIMIGDKNVWGKGLGQEAWTLAIDWLMEDKNIHKVTAGTVRPNKGMIALMEKSGMSLEAVKSKHELIENEFQDILYFAKFNPSYKNGISK